MTPQQKRAMKREINTYKKSLIDAAESVADDFEFGKPVPNWKQLNLVRAYHKYQTSRIFENILKVKS